VIFTYRSRFFFSSWFCHLSVMVCCLSSCAALFDFPSCCGVQLIYFKRLIIQSNIWASTLPIRMHDIPVTLILSYIFLGNKLLYDINLDIISLFADSSFTFLAILNCVLYRFEWMNIILFLYKKTYLAIINSRDYKTLEWIQKLPRMCVSLEIEI
jgi:hypothetical protein